MDQKLVLSLVVIQTLVFSFVLLLLIGTNRALVNQYESLLGSINTQSINVAEADINYQQIRELMAEVLQREWSSVSFDQTLPSSQESSSEKDSSQNMLAKQQSAEAASSSIFAQALSSGTWTQNNTHALMEYLPDLSQPDRIKFLNQFHQAVNRQELELEDFPPL